MLRLLSVCLAFTSVSAVAAESAEDFLSPAAQMEPLKAFFHGAEILSVTPHVIRKSTSTEIQDKDALVSYRLELVGSTAKGIFNGLFRELLVLQPKDGGKEKVLFDTSVFQPECGSTNNAILSAYHSPTLGKIAGKGDLIVLRLREDLATCVEVMPKRVETDIWLDASNAYKELFRYDAFVETGGEYDYGWTVQKTDLSLGMPRGQKKLLPGTRFVGTLRTMTATDGKKKAAVTNKTIVESAGTLSIAP